MSVGDEAANGIIRDLLTSANEEIERVHDGAALVIGRRSERGQFFPDW